ncbi:leucine-rich repeat-containing protein 37B-like isoform X4 [Narcine bancroftii]|uniref:leucine-rich repeat-containing protein 37B-like isoform X4 n=1 Tax=Narcine bancroftii TaxID=1343680 RepID=UPI003831CBD1
MAGGFGLASLVASCLLALSARSDSRRATVALPRNGPAGPEPRAVCPARCRCYLNILSCHPQKPLEPPDGAWNRTADTLTRVPKGTRGTVSGHVLTPFSVLDFRDNNISFIWKDSWLAYPSTEYLNLKGNHLTDLIPESFEGLSRLKYLFLSYNSIRFIADYMFQPTPEIELIDISNNKLFAVQSNLFRTKHGLRFLKVLDLSNNNILVLGPGAFSQLSNLHFLNISDNYLSLIGNGAFDHLNSVIYLDLRATSISLDVLKSILESTTNIVNLTHR